MTRSCSRILSSFLLVAMTIAFARPVVAGDVAGNGTANAQQEKTPMLGLTAELVKTGNVQDISYLELLFKVQFGKAYSRDVHLMNHPNENLVNFERGANVSIDNNTYNLRHSLSVKKTDDSNQKAIPVNALLLILSSDTNSECIRLSDLQPLFTDPPKDVDVFDAQENAHEFSRTDGNRTILLYAHPPKFGCIRQLEVGADYKTQE